MGEPLIIFPERPPSPRRPTPAVSEPPAAAPECAGHHGPRIARAILVLALSVWIHVWGVPSPQRAPAPYLIVMDRMTAPLFQLPGLPALPSEDTARALLSGPRRHVRVESRFVRAPVAPARERIAAAPTLLAAAEARLPVPLVTRLEIPPAAVGTSGVTLTPAAFELPRVEPLTRLERLPPVTIAAALPEPARPAAVANVVAPRNPADETRQQVDGVRALLEEYTRAYERMDVRAAKAVYPAVNDRELERRFRDLREQQVELGRCDVSFSDSGEGAAARCAASGTYKPKVGRRVIRITDKEWTFNLSRGGGGWQILEAKIH